MDASNCLLTLPGLPSLASATSGYPRLVLGTLGEASLSGIVLLLGILSVYLAWQLVKYKGLIAAENEALRNRQELQKKAEALSPVMTAMLGSDATWRSVPARFCELLEFSEKELLGKPILEVTNPEDYALEWNEFQELISGKKTSFLLQKRFITASGATVWCSMNASVALDTAGNPNGILAYYLDVTEKKRAEESVRRHEALNRQILEAVPGGYILLSAEGKFMRANNEALTWLGLSMEQLRKVAISDFEGKTIKEDGTPCLPHEYPASQCLATRKHAGPLTIGCRRNDGKMVWGIFTANPAWDPDTGLFGGAITTFVDLTERKKAEEELAQAMEFLEGVIHKAPSVAVQVFAPDGRIQLWNPASERLYGYSAEEAVGKKIQELLMTSEEVPEFEKLVDGLVRDKHAPEPYEWLIRHRSGSRKHVLSSMFAIPRPHEEVGICCIDLDISERKRAEEELQRSEALLRQVLAALPVGVWVSDHTGHLILGNPRGREIWGDTKEIGDHALERARGWWHQSGREIRPEEWGLSRAIKKGEISLKEEIDIECFDGVRKTISNSSVPLRNDQGEIVGAIVVNEDITDRMKLEEQLRHSQKMESIGQLAAGVAHDFNNILTIIRGHVDLLLRRGHIPESSRESLEQAADAADRAAGLTRQLLLFSNRQVIQPKQIDLNLVTEAALRLLRRTLGENIQVEFHRRTPLPSLYTDPVMIEQIITNLAINARDAMPTGGQLKIRTDFADLSAEATETNPDAREGQFVILEVSDTGVGMDSSTLSRIFEPFFTTKGIGRGTGLGLATVYGIVQRHQGWIETSSTPGVGTTFRLFFPVDPLEQQELEEVHHIPLPEIRGGTETILLVEDEGPLLELVKGMLEEYGYTIFAAPAGPEAIEVWQKHRDSIDLLLTDMMMPHGISGRDLAKLFVAEKPNLRVIYSSGYSVELFGDTFETNDRCRFLEKPYAPSELCRLVREVLDGKNPS